MSRAALTVLAAAFAAAHLPYLAPSLEDIDTVNFALGVRDFDVAEHRPHPPGYPVYIALGKAAVALRHAFGGEAAPSAVEAEALSLLSLLGAVAAIFLLYRVFATWSRAGKGADLVSPPWAGLDGRALAAAALTSASPLFWYMASRPMSDAPGLAAALAAQAALLLAWWRQQPDASGDRRLDPRRMAASGRMIVLGALLTALSIGFRSQNAMLTTPLLLGVLFDRIGRGVAGALIGAGVAFGVGVLLWGIPLIVASGGLDAYLNALGTQAGEDFAGVEMLYLDPTPRLIAAGLLRTLVHPWDSLALGGIVVALAAFGAVVLLLRDRRALVAIVLAAAPYLAFHLLFHDTNFVRYALPLVPPVAYLAVRGLDAIARRAAPIAVAALVVWAVSLGAPVLASYAGEASPLVRAAAALEEAARSQPPGALAMHQTFRRPLQAERVDVTPSLPSPPRREWLELAAYWRAGHTAPVWFLADPRRSDLALIDPRSRDDHRDFSWRWSSLSDLGGIRPNGVRWYRMPAPGWFAEDGWALTPETAGIARVMGRGPSHGPITARVRRREGPVHLLVGGRHLGAPDDAPVRFVLAVDGTDRFEWQTSPGFFLQHLEWPAGTLAGEGLAALTIRAASDADAVPPTAIEQFDLQDRGTLLWGFGEGWHEAEYDPRVGVWRWTSDRATLRVFGGEGPVTLTFVVDDPRRYFDDAPSVRLVAGGRVLAETAWSEREEWTVTVPREALRASGGRVTLETNQTFVPAERGGPADHRRLGLRVLDLRVSTFIDSAKR